MGANRELKFALESFWSGECDERQLRQRAAEVRNAGWQMARAMGIDVIPSGEFSLYDHVLDTIWALGAIPARFGEIGRDSLNDYFALARGTRDQRPLEMTKWFDTNYHFLVPELTRAQRFTLDASHWTEPLAAARSLGIETRPVVLGPFTFLKLAKGLEDPLALLDDLTPVYQQLLRSLAQAGASGVQLDEPALVLDPTARELDAFAESFAALASCGGPALALTTYFAGLQTGGVLERIAALAPAELHLDLIRAPEQLAPALSLLRETETRLSLGVIDGRNVWAANLDLALDRIDPAKTALGSQRITIASSCSFLHVPYEAARERAIDPEIRPWLAFCAEKLHELALLGKAADVRGKRLDLLLASAREIAQARRQSALTYDLPVRERADSLREEDYEREQDGAHRRPLQRARVALPELPTTTIGSFPQTREIRARRREFKAGRIDQAAYERFLESQIAHVVSVQEGLGLDVLVHGEPERNDMVEYFGQQLRGFAFTESGWVQSYGSRCVKPPILYGDVSRPAPMTLRWWRYAQSLTEKPMKGMLTGPVTILQWSFVRDDQPRFETCAQIALAIQDEVRDLEAAGAFAIQIDEPALREGMPLQRAAQDDYLRWAVDCFRLAVACARSETQIHTHMCYSEFNEIIKHIARLDADVLSIEASRSGMEVLDAFAGDENVYPNDIGPGVYDIHSPRVPSTEEIERLLAAAEARIGRAQLWVNPDCGLKTRRWEEALLALENMVAAAHHRRAAGSSAR